MIYLPGLGETAEAAGAVWRRAWAQGRYAVVSVQPLDDDANAWSSGEARSLDFKTLAAQRRSDVRLQRRIGRLAAVLDEVHRRAAAGDPPWYRFDYTRMVIAGYDLGAQAATTLAGQHEVCRPPNALTDRFCGGIVLSP